MPVPAHPYLPLLGGAPPPRVEIWYLLGIKMWLTKNLQVYFRVCHENFRRPPPPPCFAWLMIIVKRQNCSCLSVLIGVPEACSKILRVSRITRIVDMIFFLDNFDVNFLASPLCKSFCVCSDYYYYYYYICISVSDSVFHVTFLLLYYLHFGSNRNINQ